MYHFVEKQYIPSKVIQLNNTITVLSDMIMTIKIHQDILHKYTMCQTVYRGIYSNENAYHSFRQGKYLKNVPLSFIKNKNCQTDYN